MLRNIERTAWKAGLQLEADGSVWSFDTDWPHISRFHYRVGRYGRNEKLKALGTVSGYRITQDWSVNSSLELWDEADALDGDVVRYVEALIRELRLCDQVFDAPDLTMSQRTTIVRHVEPAPGVDSIVLTRNVVASLAAMDAPVFMLVDPWPMAPERKKPAGKLMGRGHIPTLLKLGFHRMIGSRFVWAWGAEISDSCMSEYSYEGLLLARREGRLDAVLAAAISDEVHGPLPPGLAERMDLPRPEDLDE